MDGRRRTIEMNEGIVAALEERAAEEGVSVDNLVSALMAVDGATAVSAEELAELTAISEEWRRTRMGVPFEEVDAWMKSWGTDEELPTPKVRRL